jgi:hypothetical protein
MSTLLAFAIIADMAQMVNLPGKPGSIRISQGQHEQGF